jgi:hypothetical protein
MPKKDKLTAEGLDELCANALQLVTDNKVNMKNAFDVELIEHIGELMQRYESGGEVNFHRAAGTLDASARIYAYRVDQVHSDAFKVKGSITQLNEDEKAENGGSGKARGPSKHGNHLEQARNITISDVEQDDKVDGYFKQMARKLENGGSKALLLNILPYGPDGVVFDGMQSCVQVDADSKIASDGAPLFEIPALAGRVAPNLSQLLPPELFLDSVNLSADDETAEDESVDALSPAPEAPPSPLAEDAAGFDEPALDEPALDDPADAALIADAPEDEQPLASFEDEVDFLLENVCVDSDFAFFDDIWQTRRKAKKEAEKKAEKEKAEKKEKVSFDMVEAFADQMDVDIQIGIESADKHTASKRKRAKKPELWDALTASTWPANPDSFFRLDWLDRLLPPKSKTGQPDLSTPGQQEIGALPAPEDDGAFGDDIAFAEVLDDPMSAENDLPTEEAADLCVADVPLAPTVPGHVNVQRVKRGMRSALEVMLAPSDEPPRKCMKKDSSEESVEAIPQTTFTELLTNVRSGMPAGEQSGLTVAIAFICTLHMCNEHNLELQRSDGEAFGDFNITKSAPLAEAQAPALCC